MYPHHINDPDFANALVDSFLEISTKESMAMSPLQDDVPEFTKDVYNGSIVRSPSDLPAAKPGCFFYALIYMLYKIVD